MERVSVENSGLRVKRKRSRLEDRLLRRRDAMFLPHSPELIMGRIPHKNRGLGARGGKIAAYFLGSHVKTETVGIMGIQRIHWTLMQECVPKCRKKKVDSMKVPRSSFIFKKCDLQKRRLLCVSSSLSTPPIILLRTRMPSLLFTRMPRLDCL